MGAWKAFSDHSELNRLKDHLAAENGRIAELEKVIDEASKKSEETLDILTKGIERRKEEAKTVEASLGIKKQQLESQQGALSLKEDERDKMALSTQETIKEIAAVKKEIEHARGRLVTLSTSLPAMENKISGLTGSIGNEEQRELDGKQALSSYEVITNVYKEHFTLTLSELQNYKYARPWLEKGEKFSVTNIQYDFQAGFLGLPAGKDRGLEKGMTFAVRASGRNICRIKIHEVSPRNSVGMIIPLFGNPVDLKKYKSFELIYL